MSSEHHVKVNTFQTGKRGRDKKKGKLKLTRLLKEILHISVIFLSLSCDYVVNSFY